MQDAEAAADESRRPVGPAGGAREADRTLRAARGDASQTIQQSPPDPASFGRNQIAQPTWLVPDESHTATASQEAVESSDEDAGRRAAADRSVRDEATWRKWSCPTMLRPMRSRTPEAEPAAMLEPAASVRPRVPKSSEPVAKRMPAAASRPRTGPPRRRRPHTDGRRSPVTPPTAAPPTAEECYAQAEHAAAEAASTERAGCGRATLPAGPRSCEPDAELTTLRCAAWRRGPAIDRAKSRATGDATMKRSRPSSWRSNGIRTAGWRCTIARSSRAQQGDLEGALADFNRSLQLESRPGGGVSQPRRAAGGDRPHRRSGCRLHDGARADCRRTPSSMRCAARPTIGSASTTKRSPI